MSDVIFLIMRFDKCLFTMVTVAKQKYQNLNSKIRKSEFLPKCRCLPLLCDSNEISKSVMGVAQRYCAVK